MYSFAYAPLLEERFVYLCAMNPNYYNYCRCTTSARPKTLTYFQAEIYKRYQLMIFERGERRVYGYKHADGSQVET